MYNWIKKHLHHQLSLLRTDIVSAGYGPSSPIYGLLDDIE